MILSDLSIKRPVLATVLSLVVVLIGLISYQRLTVREYPNIDEPVVTVETRYPGATAEIIESQITQPLEESLAGIDGIDLLTSISRAENSQITVKFRLSRNPDEASNDVRDRVSRVRGMLPDEIDEPIISKVEADAQPTIYLAFSSSNHTPLEITDYADRFVKDRLQNINGVANVMILGERRYAMRLWLDPARLAAYSLTPQDVETALRGQNVEIPSGRIESTEREFTVLAETDLRTPEQFEAMILRDRSGYLVRLRDVGRAEIGAESERSVVRFKGNPAVALGVVKQATANPLDISRAVRTMIPEIEAGLPAGMKVAVAYDRAIFIDRSIQNVFQTIGEAVLLVILVIFLFLRSFRSTLDAAGHHSGLADRRLRHHVRPRLFDKHPHPAGDGARHRPGGRRRHRRAGEHPSPHRGGNAAAAGGVQGEPGDRLRGHRHDPDAGGGLCSHRLHGREHRPAVHRVRPDPGRGGAGLGLRRPDPVADDVLEAAAAPDKAFDPL